MNIADLVLLAALGYVLCGLALGIPFVMRGVDRVDPAAAGASLGFRLLILPGTVALWPFMAANWLRAPAPGGTP